MKKKYGALILVSAAVMMLAAASCGGSGSTGQTEETAAGTSQPEETADETSQAPETESETNPSEETAGSIKMPEGLYMFAYYCDQDGEYVKDLNEITDYDGYPTTELQTLYDQNTTYWCELSADGTGRYKGIGEEEYDLALDPQEGLFEYDDLFFDYYYDEDQDAFWFGGDDLYYYMESCTQEDLDDIAVGRGGSVRIDKAEVGDLVCLGNYDTYPFNETTEPLFWRVIAKEDGKLLILCDKLIDSFAFNNDPDVEDPYSVTWENCSVRQFLNNDFLEMMFTQEERDLVQTTHLENKAANELLLEQWGTWEDRDGIPYSEQTYQDMTDGPETDDKVFLLSYQEILLYLGEPTEEYAGSSGYPFTEMKANSNWKALITKAVEYNALGYFDIDTRYGAWMTRTPSTAKNESNALITYITSEGEVFNNYASDPMFIRPAMWISAENA